MGFRFRKSIKAGPVRINLSKSGIGYSIGTKGFRYTKKANGGTRTTYSLPGTGLSYVTETGKKKEKTMGKEKMKAVAEPTLSSNAETSAEREIQVTRYCTHCYKAVDSNAKVCPSCGKSLSGGWSKFTSGAGGSGEKKPFYKRWWFIALIVCALLGSCNNSDDTDTPIETFPTESTAVATTDHIDETTTPITTEVPTSAPTETTEAPTSEPTEPPATEASNAKNTTSTKDTTSTAKEYTYVLNTSTRKFHYSGCSSVKQMKDSNKSSFTGTRQEVIAKGYSPCGNCYP